MPFLHSFTSLFSGGSSSSSPPSSSRHAARRNFINSTNNAFSLPTTSRYGEGLGVSGLPDVPQADSENSSPGPSRRASYTTYPPNHDAYRPALAVFPPLSNTFHRLRNALADTFPELLETLNPPVDPAILAAFEQELGCPLPQPVRDSYLVADGQDLESCSNISGSGGIFYGLHMLPLDEVMREWAFWRQVERDPGAGRNPAVLATMASVPPGWVKTLYACRGWLPLLSDRAGNYVGVDLDPGPSGAWGQVIVFGRDFDRKCVLWRGEGEGGWGKWLAGFVDELESGEGWEADKSNSSDEEDEIGYSSYNGGAMYGELGTGLRLAGEYRGWNVLEAWWDKSVRKWEALGLGLDVDEVEKGLEEARRLSGMGQGRGNQVDSSDIGMRTGESSAQVEIPVIGDVLPAPPTPVQADVDVLLPPSSPEQNIPRIQTQAPAPSPVRIITPLASTSDHPLKQRPDAEPSPATSSRSGFLSPPTGRSPPRSGGVNSKRLPVPAPIPLDLPTRADVQAAQAVAVAEASGLRGGWVMNLDTSAGSAQRRGIGNGHYGINNVHRYPRGSMDAEMVDIDLEGGKGEKFGSPRMSDVDIERQKDDERLSLAGVEHRRASPHLHNPPSRSTSPLSSTTADDYEYTHNHADNNTADWTPRAPSRDPSMNNIAIPAAVVAANSAIRRPPKVATSASSERVAVSRSRTPEGERETGVIRVGGGGSGIGEGRARMERESSVVSADSHEGLLDWQGSASGGDVGFGVSVGTATPPVMLGTPTDGSPEKVASFRISVDEIERATRSGAGEGRERMEQLADSFQNVAIEN